MNAAWECAQLRVAPGVMLGPQRIALQCRVSLCRGALVGVLPKYSAADLGIYTLVPSSRYLSTKVRHLVDQLATEFGENPPWDRWRKAASSPTPAASS